MIKIDGSQGEGGGALVRTALALSALTDKPFQITNIRAGRPQPGLKAQHLEAIKALKQICSAETNQIELGSTELIFTPNKIKKGAYNFDIRTAGSITLFLQAILLPCLFAPGRITLNIKGGTSGKWQASVDYLQNILLPHLRKFVKEIDLKILKRGYYPQGGGEIQLDIHPKIKIKDFANFPTFWKELQENTTNINLIEQGKLEQIKGVVNCSRDLEKNQVAERINNSAQAALKKLQCPADIRTEYAQTASTGGELVLWAKFSQNNEINFQNPVILGGDALAEKGKSAEEVGKEAAQELVEEIQSQGCTDKHLTDQLLIFMALLSDSQIKASAITNHTKTNIQIIEQFLPIQLIVEEKEIRIKEKF